MDTVKQSEDGKNIVVRFYENNNRTTDTILNFANKVKHAWICNMLEKNECELVVVDGKVPVKLKPFEVQTLRLEFE